MRMQKSSREANKIITILPVEKKREEPRKEEERKNRRKEKWKVSY